MRATSLEEWLINYVANRYEHLPIPKPVVEFWLARGRLLVILDGLDEVAPLHSSRDEGEEIQTGIELVRDYLKTPGRSEHFVLTGRDALMQYWDQLVSLGLEHVMAILPVSRDSAEAYLDSANVPREVTEEFLSSEYYRDFAGEPLWMQLVAITSGNRPTLESPIWRRDADGAGALWASYLKTVLDPTATTSSVGHVPIEDVMWLAKIVTTRLNGDVTIDKVSAAWCGAPEDRVEVEYRLHKRLKEGMITFGGVMVAMIAAPWVAAQTRGLQFLVPLVWILILTLAAKSIQRLSEVWTGSWNSGKRLPAFENKRHVTWPLGELSEGLSGLSQYLRGTFLLVGMTGCLFVSTAIAIVGVLSSARKIDLSGPWPSQAIGWRVIGWIAEVTIAWAVGTAAIATLVGLLATVGASGAYSGRNRHYNLRRRWWLQDLSFKLSERTRSILGEASGSRLEHRLIHWTEDLSVTSEVDTRTDRVFARIPGAVARVLRRLSPVASAISETEHRFVFNRFQRPIERYLAALVRVPKEVRSSWAGILASGMAIGTEVGTASSVLLLPVVATFYVSDGIHNLTAAAFACVVFLTVGAATGCFVGALFSGTLLSLGCRLLQIVSRRLRIRGEISQPIWSLITSLSRAGILIPVGRVRRFRHRTLLTYLVEADLRRLVATRGDLSERLKALRERYPAAADCLSAIIALDIDRVPVRWFADKTILGGRSGGPGTGELDVLGELDLVWRDEESLRLSPEFALEPGTAEELARTGRDLAGDIVFWAVARGLLVKQDATRDELVLITLATRRLRDRATDGTEEANRLQRLESVLAFIEGSKK